MSSETAVIEQTLRELRSPGTTARSKRVREFLFLATREERRKDPSLAVSAAREKASERLAALANTTNAKAIVRQLVATAPTSITPKREYIDDYVEIAAALRNPVMRWLCSWMLARTNARGPRPDRSMVLAVFMHMAFALGRPDIRNTWKGFQRGQTLRNWAFNYPKPGPRRSAFYDSMRNMLSSRPANVLLHANLDLIDQLAKLKKSDGSLRHPDIGRIGVVDATLIEADIPQHSYLGEAQRLLLAGPRRRKASFVRYTHQGNTTRRCFGYKLLILSDLASTLPLAWRLIPAGGDERKETLRLLRDYFALVPQSRMWALVGDALYDKSRSFAHQLVFKWGLHPVFPQAGAYGEHLPHAKTLGVPHCAHGEMKLKDWDGFMDADSRLAAGIPRGQEVSPNARLRWVCSHSKPGRRSGPGICKGVETKPHTDARLYTFLPRGGSHSHAALRTAFLLRRNSVESINASLKNLGLGGKDQQRPGWAGDLEMDWLLSTALTFLTARRLAHESGAYDVACAEAVELGLWAQPTETNPAPGPTADEWAAVRDAREAAWLTAGDLPRAPRTWNDLRWRNVADGCQQDSGTPDEWDELLDGNDSASQDLSWHALTELDHRELRRRPARPANEVRGVGEDRRLAADGLDAAA